MMSKKTYRAILCNSAGELDMISAADIETLQRHLGKRLVTQEWLLADGDTITITSGDIEQIT
jgi:hypothetical protein